MTGKVGTVYSIQYATNLSTASIWTERMLVQVRETNNVWSDPSAISPSQRFYRSVSVPAPADTNLVFIEPGTFTMGSRPTEALRDSGRGPTHGDNQPGFLDGQVFGDPRGLSLGGGGKIRVISTALPRMELAMGQT
jgi:hypothetical protein